MVLKRHSSFILLVLKNCTFGFADYTNRNYYPIKMDFLPHIFQFTRSGNIF